MASCAVFVNEQMKTSEACCHNLAVSSPQIDLRHHVSMPATFAKCKEIILQMWKPEAWEMRPLGGDSDGRARRWEAAERVPPSGPENSLSLIQRDTSCCQAVLAMLGGDIHRIIEEWEGAPKGHPVPPPPCSLQGSTLKHP